MIEHVDMLVRIGCFKWNPHSKYCSLVMIVPKKGQGRIRECLVVADCKYK